MKDWLIFKRMTRFRQVHRDIIDTFIKKVRKVDVDLSVRLRLDEDAAQNSKARNDKAEDGFKKVDERSETGQVDGWRLRGEMVDSKEWTLE